MRKIARTKLNASSTTTVPKAVKLFLGLEAGDRIAWCVEDEKIIVKKAGKREG